MMIVLCLKQPLRVSNPLKVIRNASRTNGIFKALFKLTEMVTIITSYIYRAQYALFKSKCVLKTFLKLN